MAKKVSSIAAVLVIFAALLGVTYSSEVTQFREQCLLCTGFGNWWCLDDPNLVNLSKNRCYNSGEDKATYCNDFEFVRNPLLCDTVNFTQSDACDQFEGQNMKFNRPWSGTAKLAPRTSCGFFLNQYSAFLDI